MRLSRMPPASGENRARSAKGAARTTINVKNRFAPHSVLREFFKSAKGAARTTINVKNRFAPHSVLREFPR